MAKLLYQVDDKPKFGQLIVFALQQLLAIIAGTITVPLVAFGKVDGPVFISAAILGCGIGTLTYIFITKRRSPVILSSNFAFIGALSIAYASYGAMGVVLGGLFTGTVYIVLSLVVRRVGTAWIDKLLPPIVIGPVVALIGLTLAPNAMADLVTANGYSIAEAGAAIYPYNLVALLCGLITFFVSIICSMQTRFKGLYMAPFLVGIVAGYALAAIFTGIGYGANVEYLKIINFDPIVANFQNISVTSFLDYPRFSTLMAGKEIAEGAVKLTWVGVAEIALAFIPVSLVSFSEHIADHKNLSSVIGHDLLNDEPGLHRTLLGDGVGQIVGSAFGICPNTTYSQSIGCVAITKNASVWTMIVTSIMCIVLAFFTPLIVILQTIPSCVMGGICLALYGFIASSGLRMIKGVEFGEGKNLYTLSAILVAGVGGLVLSIPYEFNLAGGNVYVASRAVTISSIAFALIIGVATYAICSAIEKRNPPEEKEGE